MMKDIMFKKEHLGYCLSVHNSFKSFAIFVILLFMTTSNVLGAGEIISGYRCLLDPETKTAILYSGPKSSSNVVVPEKVKSKDGTEYLVVALGQECFATSSTLSSITIPSSITSLGFECFKGCKKLTSITLPPSVTELGEGCFKDCIGMTSITIPSSLTKLSLECFSGCSSLKSITIPSSVTELGLECFSGCSSLKSITIPSSVTELGDDCFKNCSNLTSITLPSSITSLKRGSFNGCYNLRSITIPSSVTSLGAACFELCMNLTSVTIPSSVTSLGNYCFSYCEKLTSITIPSSVTELGEGCFRLSSIRSITLPSVMSLGYRCFEDCQNLQSITILSSVTSLPSECFKNCNNLTSITIPSSVTELGYRCFGGCSLLKSITLPPSVTELGEGCFKDWNGLTSITIPSSVTEMGYKCFDGCTNLENLYFKGKLPHFSYSSPFKDILTHCIIKVPLEYLQDYKKAFGPDYQFISAWHPNDEDDKNNFVTQCANPSVSYESGKLKFDCETTGVKYHYTISDKDIAENVLSQDGKVDLSAAYDISVYATADGYAASDKTEGILNWLNGKLENTTNINRVRTRGLMVSTHNGIIIISGLTNGEIVKLYTADGKLLSSTPAVDGVVSYATSEAKVVAKIGSDVINVLTK